MGTELPRAHSNFSLSNELSLRGPNGTVAIPKGFRVILYEVFLKSGGLPHQCAHWFAMTHNR